MSQEWLTITIGTILVNNFVLSKFYGICPFLGVSRKLDSAIGMSGAVIFVMTIASFITSLISKYFLSTDISFSLAGYQITGNLNYMKTIIFIAVIASIVQVAEIILKKITPSLYSALGVYLPLITTNCAILACAVENTTYNRSLLMSTVYGFCSGIGFALALILFSSLREKLDLAKIPKPFEGMAIALITGGILAMGFTGFAALVK